MKTTKYFKLVSTISSLEIYIKIDEWNGENIIHYPCCTLYNGTIVYNILCEHNVYKKGFDTHKNDKKKTVVVRQSFAEKLLERFDFLFKDYGFKLEKIDLGNAIDENGKFFFYGPVYCYYIYNDDVCINILNLVQRQDYNIYITKNKSDDQTYIRKGVSVEGEYAYNIGLFATYIKASIESTGEIYGFKIN